MPARVCPFCNRVLLPFEHYFCSSCGKKLPDELVKPFKTPSTLSIVQEVKVQPKALGKLKAIDKRKVMAGSFVLLGLVSLVLIFVNVVPKLPGLLGSSPSAEVAVPLPEEKPVPVINPEKTIESQRDLKAGVFGSNDFARFVPFEADIYMEVFDPKWVLSNTAFFGEELAAIVGSLDVPFCVFAYQEGEDVFWTFMLNDQGGLDIEEVFSKVTSDYWKHEVVSDKVVISGSEDIIKMVSDSAEGLTKSYSMNPFYAKAVSASAKEGQVLIIMSGYEGKKILEDLSQRQDWEDISPLLLQALDLGYNEIVIR